MPKKKVFVSFDYSYDLNLKRSLVAQSREPDSPFSINDFSLQESEPEETWLDEAQSKIARCDVFIAIVGKNTHSAPGVLKEVAIAKGSRKPRFQIRPKGKDYGEVADAG